MRGFPPPLLSGSTSLKKMACHSYGKGLYLHTWGVCRMPRRTPGRCWSCCRCPRTRRTWTPRTAATRGCRSDEASTQNSCLDNNVKKMYHMKILKKWKKVQTFMTKTLRYWQRNPSSFEDITENTVNPFLFYKKQQKSLLHTKKSIKKDLLWS